MLTEKEWVLLEDLGDRTDRGVNALLTGLVDRRSAERLVAEGYATDHAVNQSTTLYKLTPEGRDALLVQRQRSRMAVTPPG
jgi:hypothetical protein